MAPPSPAGSSSPSARPAALLCTVPPFATNTPPAGAAALLGYLARHGCHDFGFLDLQLAFPSVPLTYSPAGPFGESFARDVPDLPLVLRLLRALDEGRAPRIERDAGFDAYCLARAIHPGALWAALEQLGAGLRDRFLEGHPEVGFVGFTVWSSNFLATLLAAAHLKRRARPPFVVAGGPQLTESPASAALALRSGLFDAVALGEGEATLLELYLAFREGKPTRGIAGTAWLEADGRTVGHGADRALLKMAQLPPPDFGPMLLPAYRLRGGRRVLPHALSRGCVAECAFCSERGFWQRFRPALAEQAVDHAEILVSRFGAEHLQLTDSLANGHWGRLTGFAEGLLQRGLADRLGGWSAFFRADMDRETARLLSRAGLASAFVGVESLCDATLERMNKGLDAGKSLGSLTAFLEAGIEVQVGVIPGFPGDTREGFLDTVSRLVALQERFPGRLGLNVEPFVVSPGQAIARDLARWGLRGVGWDEATLEIAPRYRDIAEQVLCRVEGENQGAERLGLVRLVHSLSAAAPAGEPFSFQPVVGEGLLLLVLKEPSGTTYRLITDSEREALERARRAAPGDGGGLGSEVQRLLAEIERRHLALPSNRALAGPSPREGEVALSPLAVARTFEEHGVAVLFDTAGHGLVRLPATMAGIVELMSKPVTVEQLNAAAGEGCSAGDIVGTLQEAGLLAGGR